MHNKYTRAEFHHRSRERIKILGEVFTPETYVYDMLNLIDNKVWGDENIVFFEPCCGHGNIVLSIFSKRIEAFYKKYNRTKNTDSSLYAVANAINTLWAVDIDRSNVVDCQRRILEKSINFLVQNLNQDLQSILKIHLVFMSHLICAINWQIHENETLSALSNKKEAAINARKTKMGHAWFIENGHTPLDLDLTWCEYFKICEEENSIPIIYEKATKIIAQVLDGTLKKVNGFEYVYDCLKDKISISSAKKISRGKA